MSVTLPEAFSFSCPYDLEDIRKKLEALGTFHWTRHDNDTYGLYVSGRPTIDSWPVKPALYFYDQTYTLDMGYSYWRLKEGQSAKDAIAFVKDKLLPAIGATNVCEAPAFR